MWYSSFQIDTLQRSLSDARENCARLSSTIESLMTSHTELQEVMERLQTDMGQKESELNILRRDKYVFYHLGKEKTYELTLYLDLASFIFYKTQDFLSRADQTAAVREWCITK